MYFRFTTFALALAALSLRAQVTVTYTNGQTNSTAYDTSAPTSPLTLTIGSGSATQNGLLSGSGSVVKDGAGTLKLTTANTYTGGTTLNAGILALGADNALGTGTLTINGGNLRAADAGRTLTNAVIFAGDFALGRFTNLAGAISLANDITLTASNPDTSQSITSSTLSGVISGDYGLTFTESTNAFTTIVLAGANTYTGDTVFSSGRLTLANALALQNSTFNYQYGEFSFGGLTSATFGGLAGRNDLTLGYNPTDAVALTVGDNNASTTYIGFLQGSGSLTKVGSGTLTLTGYNTYSGGTTVSAGTLQIGDGSTSGTYLNGNVVNNASLVFNLASSLPYTGVISGAGSVTKTGGGRLILWGANTHTGDTLLQGGELRIANVLTLQNSTVNFQGGALTFNALDSATLGGLAGTQPIGLADSFGNALALTVGNNNASTTYSGVLSGAGSLTKIGTGTLALSGANTYTGATTISGGTLSLSGSGALSTGALFLTGGATLDLGGTTQTVAGLGSSSSRVVGNLTAGTLATTGNTYLQSGTFANTFTGSSATGRLWIGGDASATVYLTGTNDRIYTTDHNQVIIGHSTTGAAGTVKLANANALAAATENAELFAGTLDLNGQANVRANSLVLQSGSSSTLINSSTASAASFAGGVTFATGAAQLGGAGDLTLSGTLSGTGGFTKFGTGTLTLSGTNTYSGATAISAGTLRVNGALANTAVTVASGATLGGSGFIDGLTTLNSGGHLAPGNSPGTLTFTDGLTINPGTILDLELGTLSDLIRVSGGTLSGPPGTGGITLNLTNAGSFAPATYVLFDFTGATTSSFDISDFTLGTTITGYDYSFALTGSHLELTAVASAIPEPSTYAAIFGVLVLGLAARRRLVAGRNR